MTMGSRNKCTACFGDGRCAQCDGSGINAHLDEDEPKCRNCSGTGVCPVCKGSGAWMVPPPEIIELHFGDLPLGDLGLRDK